MLLHEQLKDVAAGDSHTLMIDNQNIDGVIVFGDNQYGKKIYIKK